MCTESPTNVYIPDDANTHKCNVGSVEQVLLLQADQPMLDLNFTYMYT